MKVIATKTSHGDEGLLVKGRYYNVSRAYYKKAYEDKVKKGQEPLVMPVEKEEKASYQTKEDKTPKQSKTYEKSGPWYTVYQDGEEVDKFKGKEGLKQHGFDV